MKTCSLAACPPEPPPSAAPVHGPEAEQALATLAKALGHPVRVRILKRLLQEDGCVCGALVSELQLAQSTVSQHLKVLKDAGLIRGAIAGPSTCYCASPSALARFATLLDALKERP